MAQDPYAEFRSASDDPYAEFQAPKERSWGESAVEVGKGALKWAGGVGRNLQNLENFGQTPEDFNPFPAGSKGAEAYAATQQAYRDYDKRLEPSNLPQKVGKYGAEVASYFVPTGLGEAEIGAGVARQLPKIAKFASFAAEHPRTGAALYEGVRVGTKEAIEQGAKTFRATGDPKDAAVGAAVGGGVGAAYGALSGPLADWLKKSSRESFATFLRPRSGRVQTKALKTVLSGTEKDAVGRGRVVISGSVEKQEALNNTLRSGQLLNDLYGKLDKKAQFKLKPVYDTIWEWVGREGLFNDGTVKNQKAIDAGLDLMREITEKLGSDMEAATPSKIRDMRDLFTERAKLYKTNATGVSVKAPGPENDAYRRKLLEVSSNSFRDILNSNSPSLNRLNREYSFWKSYHEMLKARETSLFGQMRFGNKLWTTGRVIGAGALGEEYGRRKGGPTAALEYGIAGAIGGAALSIALESPLWKTGVEAAAKNKIADLLAAGRSAEADAITARAMAKATFDPVEKAKWIARGKQIAQQQQMQAAAQKAAQQAQQAQQTQMIAQMKKPTTAIGFPQPAAGGGGAAVGAAPTPGIGYWKNPTTGKFESKNQFGALSEHANETEAQETVAQAKKGAVGQNEPKVYFDKKQGMWVAEDWNGKKNYVATEEWANKILDEIHAKGGAGKTLPGAGIGAPAGTGFTAKSAPAFVKQTVSEAGQKPGAAAVGSAEFKKQATKTYKAATTAYEQASKEAEIASIQAGTNLPKGAFKINKVADLSHEEASSISFYKGHGYKELNKELYTHGKLSPQHVGHVKLLDSAISKHHLSEDVTLWRGLHGSFGQHLSNLNVGDSFVSKGYNSSTSAIHVSKSFGTGTILKIEAKMGQKGYPYGFKDYEKEYLLPRNLHFEVTGKEQRGSITFLTVRIK